jgi:maleylpyruvate isomerase
VELDAVIERCRQSHRQLEQTLVQLDNTKIRAKSLLPGWSVGHLLTHLAGNADSHVRILEAAMQGKHVEQYEGGAEGRAVAIERGAQRSADILIEEVMASSVRLEEVWKLMTSEAWSGFGLQGGVKWPCRLLPYSRWREVEVHHVDIGATYNSEDWPAEFLDAELHMDLVGLPERISSQGERARLLEWLLGRTDQPPLELIPWQGCKDRSLIPGAN